MQQGESMMADGVEWGFAVCRRGNTLTRGPESSGHRYGVTLDVSCPQGRPAALFHTHPGGEAYPSEADLREAKRLEVPWLCIGTPRDGRVTCHRVR